MGWWCHRTGPDPIRNFSQFLTIFHNFQHFSTILNNASQLLIFFAIPHNYFLSFLSILYLIKKRTKNAIAKNGQKMLVRFYQIFSPLFQKDGKNRPFSFLFRFQMIFSFHFLSASVHNFQIGFSFCSLPLFLFTPPLYFLPRFSKNLLWNTQNQMLLLLIPFQKHY